ncbi:hypothetical protein ACH3XW_20415 [Acanthocheilonema viteae]
MHWEQVIVGDFLHVCLDEIIPADILLIRSSDRVCFVTNLKQRYVPASLLPHSGEESLYRLTQLRSKVLFEKPNNQINQIRGQIIYENDVTEVIRNENMIFRGCQLQNTTFVEGIVLYAGNESKIVMINSDPLHKRSSLEITTN